MVILEAESKTFFDGGCGIRQEHPGTNMVFPVSSSTLTNEYNLVLTRLNHPTKACFTCGRKEAEGEKLLKCARCKGALYCEKACQLRHWKSAHKRLCSSTSKLVNLAAVDFSTFDHFLTWGFKTPLSTFDEESIGHKMVEYISKLIDGIPKNSDTPIGPITIENFERSFIITSLKRFRDAVVKDSSKRHLVVDQNGPPSLDNDMRLLAIPHWQRLLALTGVDWLIETDGPVPIEMIMAMDVFQQFDTHALPPFAHIIRHLPSETLLYSPDFIVLAFHALETARKNPDRIFIRVLQAPCDPRAASMITEATKAERPPNVFDLWIRRSYYPHSRFRPMDASSTLLEQLLDIQNFRDTDDNDASNEKHDRSQDIQCAACKLATAKSSFSKNQLRKHSNKIRCKLCVHVDRPCK